VPRMSIPAGMFSTVKSPMGADRRSLQSQLLRLDAETRLYGRALQSMSDVDFEAELAAWCQLATEITAWVSSLTPRELEVLARTGDQGLVEAMVQARPDG